MHGNCVEVVGDALNLMEPSFEKLLVRLVDHEVQFIVVGGVAVALQGYMRMTEDVDILIESSPNNVERLLRALADYGEGFARELSPGDFTDEEGAIRIIEESEYCQIDIFTRMVGLHYSLATMKFATRPKRL